MCNRGKEVDLNREGGGAGKIRGGGAEEEEEMG